jgi:hypothetical protein
MPDTDHLPGSNLHRGSSNFAFTLHEQVIYETIVVLPLPSGKVHASPVGVRFTGCIESGKETFEAIVYQGAVIHDLLVHARRCIIQFPALHQVDVFVLGFKDLLPEYAGLQTKDENIGQSPVFYLPFLKSIENFFEVRVTDTIDELIDDRVSRASPDNDSATKIMMETVAAHVRNPHLPPFCRYPGLFVEFLVAASRAKMLDPRTSSWNALLVELHSMAENLKKIAPLDERNRYIDSILLKLAS